MLNIDRRVLDGKAHDPSSLLIIIILKIRGMESLTKQADTLHHITTNPRTTPRRRTSKHDVIRTQRLRIRLEGPLRKPRVRVQQKPTIRIRHRLDAKIPRTSHAQPVRHPPHIHAHRIIPFKPRHDLVLRQLVTIVNDDQRLNTLPQTPHAAFKKIMLTENRNDDGWDHGRQVASRSSAGRQCSAYTRSA